MKKSRLFHPVYDLSNLSRFPAGRSPHIGEVKTWRIVLLEYGGMEFRFPSKRLEMKSGDICFLSPGRRECHFSSDQHVCYWFVAFHSKQRLFRGPGFIINAEETHRAALAGLVKTLHLEKPRDSVLLEAAVRLALSSPPPKHKADPRLARVIRFLNTHPGHECQVEAMAHLAGLSQPHFRRLFRHQFGMSPKQYLLRQQMKDARGLLQNEGMRVNEVSDLLGFPSVFQFSNQYQKVLGHRPSEDRKT